MSPLVLLLLAPAAEPPKPAAAGELYAKPWSPELAGGFLDTAGLNWTQQRKCVTCHTNMPYLMARPLVGGDPGPFKEVRAFFDADADKWAAGGKPRGPAYAVATAAGLAFADNRDGKLSPQAEAAFAAAWKLQKPTGEWDWLKCDWPPLEHDDYFGAVLAAVAVGVAPGDYAKSDAAKVGIGRLRAYLAKTPPPDLHHTLFLLWASARLDGLLTPEAKAKAIADLRAKQGKDGGWALPALGKYDRRDGSPNDPTSASDGYATGLAVLVLRESGVAKEDPAVTAGVSWLKANQRASGRWFTRSLNNDKAHYIANAGTAFAVMALAACGETSVAGR